MAASSLNLKHFSRLLHTSSLRPMNLRFSHTDAAEKAFYKMFKVQREPEPTTEKPDLPPFIHHEFKAVGRGDGLDIRLYMAGVNKDKVKVWIEGDNLIAEGKMEKDSDDEDDTDLPIRYKISRPPTEVFNLDATKAEIKNGVLKVFVPKKDQDVKAV